MFEAQTIDNRLKEATNHSRNAAVQIQAKLNLSKSYKRKKALMLVLDNFDKHCALVGSVTEWTGTDADLADHMLGQVRNISVCLTTYNFLEMAADWKPIVSLWERACRHFLRQPEQPVNPSTLFT